MAERDHETERDEKISRALKLISFIRKAKGKKRKSTKEQKKGCNEKNTKKKNKKYEPTLKIGKVDEEDELEGKGRKDKKRKKEDKAQELVEWKAELMELCAEHELAGEQSIRIKCNNDGLELVRLLQANGFSGSLEVDLPHPSKAVNASNFCVDLGFTKITIKAELFSPPSREPSPPPFNPAPLVPPSPDDDWWKKKEE